MKKEITQKTRLKKRIHAYRNFGCNFVYMFESDFRGVFSPEMMRKGFNGSPSNFGEELDKLIESCSEEECMELNFGLDEYQLQKKFEK